MRIPEPVVAYLYNFIYYHLFLFAIERLRNLRKFYCSCTRLVALRDLACTRAEGRTTE